MLYRKTVDELDTTKPVFLWYPFIPYGVTTVFQGKTGYGKTTMILRVMAELSHGIFPPRMRRGAIKDRTEATEWERYAIAGIQRKEDESMINTSTAKPIMHNGVEIVGIDDEDFDETDQIAPALDPPFMRQAGEPVKMVYISRENSDKVIKDKYMSFGGDPRYLEIIDEKEDRFVAQRDKMMELVGDAKFVVIDTIDPFMDGKMDNNKDVAAMMQDFQVVAHDTGSAILLINDLTKKGVSNSDSRLRAFILMNTAPHIFELDKKSNFLYLESIKNNLAPAYGRIAALMDDLGRPGFMNYDRLQDILNTSDRKRGQKEKDAIQFLKNLLAEGPVASKEVFEAAEKAGIKATTLIHSKKKANVESHRTNRRNSVWMLKSQQT